jgi:hypothetical protein
MPGAPDVPHNHRTLPDDNAIVEARESTFGGTFIHAFVTHAHLGESSSGR